MRRNQLLDLDIDVMFIDIQPMLTTTDRSIKYRCLVPFYIWPDEYIYLVSNNALRYYNRAGFL